MTRILIIGAGGHAQVIADVVFSRIRVGEDWILAGFLDDDPRLLGSERLGIRVLGTSDQVDKFEHDALVIGIGDNVVRAEKFDYLTNNGEKFATLIHPRATIAEDVLIGDGSIVFAGAVINTGSVIGPNTIVNTGATIDHHARIGAHCHIGPGVHLGGSVTLGEGVFLGIGGSVIPNRSIDEWTTVGAGGVVTHDLPARVTAVGMPARIMKSR